MHSSCRPAPAQPQHKFKGARWNTLTTHCWGCYDFHEIRGPNKTSLRNARLLMPLLLLSLTVD